MRFQSRVVQIDAVLFNGENAEELTEFCLVNSPSFFQMLTDEEKPMDSEVTARVWDKLHDTWVFVKPGQYVIKGTKGEFYPCDAEVFAEKYEGIA